MAEGKSRKIKFLKDHPTCCFCGGCAAAVEEDHQPGRVFFRDREWPEGFCFPSCTPCNRISRDAENLTSLLVADLSTDRSRAAYRKRIASIRYNYPAVIPDLFKLNANDKRRAMRHLYIDKPPGAAFADLPVVTLNRAFWQSHLDLLARKILLALHYYAFNQPLSVSGRIWLNIQSNADDLSTEWFQAIVDMTGRYVFPARNTRSLLDQMTLQWGAMTEHKIAVFVITLQKRMIISGITSEAPHLQDLPTDSVFSAFNWD